MEDLRSGIEHLKQAKAHMSEANGIMSGHISKLKALEEENAELKAELADWKGNAEGFQPDAYMKLPLDADGEPIRIGDVLYSSGNECRVVSITVKADEACVGVHTDEGAFLPSVNPKYLSRKNPEPLEPEVLDADGVPIKVGDVVYFVRGAGVRYAVKDIIFESGGAFVGIIDEKVRCPLMVNPDTLTHERPDSWEKLEEDARKTACNYALAPRDEDGITTCDGCRFQKSESCSNEMTIDLVERAKKLAKAGEVE